MISQTLVEIERSISSLSMAEIAEMANDPDIQVEIAAINQEFLVAEMDGLEAL
ncbi:MAG: hypothetical protein JGK23_33810 [Microcoleus sp. PH2017_19_SFW_U_A]|nr:hypothetical protein [Microcoleus sp. PH2017_19_SFW_U_A]